MTSTPPPPPTVTRAPAVATTRTDELRPGDLLDVPGLFTEYVEVESVGPSGFVNYRGEDVLTVRYVGPPVNRWGTTTEGNSAAASSEWIVVQTCEWGRGPDPASGCDEIVTILDGLCPTHRAAAQKLANGMRED